MLLHSPAFANNPLTARDSALIGTWSIEWGDIHFYSRSIEINEDGTFTDSETKKIRRGKSTSSKTSGTWESIEACVLKFTPKEGEEINDHYFLYYRIEKGIYCYFSTSSILRATEDGKLTSEEKTYRRKGKPRNKDNKTSIEGMWEDQSTKRLAFVFYRNGTFVRERLSNKSEQWSQIGYEFLLWEKPRLFEKVN